MHPPTTAATGTPMRARRFDPVGRRLDNSGDLGPDEITALVDDSELDQLPRQAPGDEDNSAIVSPSEAIAAGNEMFDAYLLHPGRVRRPLRLR